MTELINQPELSVTGLPTAPIQNELSILKARADKLGIKYSPNIGIETLKERINAVVGTKPEPAQDTEASIRTRIRKDALRLIRCQIVNLNPNKKNWEGEIITVANKYTGTVRKFVPFGEKTINGYHIPNIIYKMLKDRKFLSITSRRDPKTGAITVKQQWVPEFSLVVLPQLTEKELKDLATAQKAAGSIDVSE